MKNIFAKKNNKNENLNFGGETSKIGILVFVGLFIFFFISAPVSISASAVKSVSNSGLIGYWPLNDGAGTKANDMSGNRSIGTLTGSPTWVTGRVGKALSFAGGMYVSVPSNDILTIQGNFTLSVWIKTSTTGTGGTSNYRDIISKVPSGSPWPGYVIAINGNGAISVWTASNVAGAWSNDSGYNLADGRWHLVSVSLSGTTIQIYVDGVAKGSFTKAIPGSNNNGVFSIGAEVGTTASRDFIGLIDDARVYNRTLSIFEVKNIYQFGSAQIKSVSNSGLVGYWPLNDGAGTRANDMSGNKNSGTISGTPSWVNGRFNKALSFDGSTNYIQAGTVPSLTKNGTYTFSAWLKSSTVGTQTIFQSAPSCVDRNGAALSGNTLLFGYYNGTAWVGASGSVPSNEYFHFVGVNNGGTLSLYINGVLQVGTGVPYVHCADGNLYLGQETYPGNPTKFAGIMDDVRVYSRVLSASEILQLYKQNATQINSPRNDFLTNGLVGLWSFDGKDMNWATNKALDRSSGGNDGVLTNMSTTSSPINGKIGQALKFDGSSYITTTGSTSNGSASVFAWINPSFLGTCPGASPNLCEIVMISSNFLFEVGSGVLSIYGYVFNTPQWVNIYNSNITINKWMYVGFTYDQTTLRVYLDGEQIGTANVPGVIGTGGNIKIGGDNNFRLFKGKIDDVRVYNRTLSATEVKQLYNLAR